MTDFFQKKFSYGLHIDKIQSAIPNNSVLFLFLFERLGNYHLEKPCDCLLSPCHILQTVCNKFGVTLHSEKTYNHIKMSKTFKIEVDCANCANLVEDAAKKVAGVKELSISFMTQKMKVEFEEGADKAAVMAEVLKVAKKVEPDFEIL